MDRPHNTLITTNFVLDEAAAAFRRGVPHRWMLGPLRFTIADVME